MNAAFAFALAFAPGAVVDAINYHPFLKSFSL